MSCSISSRLRRTSVPVTTSVLPISFPSAATLERSTSPPGPCSRNRRHHRHGAPERVLGAALAALGVNEPPGDAAVVLVLKRLADVGVVAGFDDPSSDVLAFATMLGESNDRFGIAVNLTLNFLKKRKRRTGLSLNDLDSSVQQDPALIDTTHEANPERQTNLNELQIKLNEAMMKLSEPHRMVVTMFDIQGMSHGEIAKVLNTSEGTIRSRLHYAHLQLQSALQDSWEERF